MPSSGWDWAELQEASLKAKRTNATGQNEFKELEKLYLEEISGHLETIKEQRETIDDLNNAISCLENAQSDHLNIPINMLANLIGGNCIKEKSQTVYDMQPRLPCSMPMPTNWTNAQLNF